MLGAGLQFGRSRGGEDRFYNPAKARRNRQNQDNLRRAQSDVTPTQSTASSGTEEPENRAVKPSKPIPLEPPMLSSLCNLERFLESITPFVPAQYPSKRDVRGWRTQDECQPYFVLGDLWESFKEWSAYGAGVPLILNDSDSVVQYYVPYLSGIQLYSDPLKSSTKSRQHIEESFSSDDNESPTPQNCLSFEYLERNQPWGREPLTDKILDLARKFPELKNMKSCDLLPSSWLSVAWYPIYRIPMGPTLKDLDACFLTFHNLHTPMTGNECGETDGFPKMSLPVFGLASYKLKSTIVDQQ
ncbi:unnamed protein product [Lactuca virosa]|uniref:DUF789 domain-containing protein n=1 Tax=Lactuca virosa TaxID=75947 RepID=A0AAU9MZW0_9ASTR|nr:unnamed protein product [Lactuca virosa]